MTRTRTLGVVIGTAALALAAVPALAQDDAETMAEPIEVGGVEYAFTGLPTSVPAGTELTLRNDGAELHEIFVMRVADDVTESFDELMAMGEEAMTSGKVVPVSEAPLVVMPGETSEGSIALEQEGRHVAICFVPQGVIPADLAALGITDIGPDMDVPLNFSPPVPVPERAARICMPGAVICGLIVLCCRPGPRLLSGEIVSVSSTWRPASMLTRNSWP